MGFHKVKKSDCNVWCGQIEFPQSPRSQLPIRQNLLQALPYWTLVTAHKMVRLHKILVPIPSNCDPEVQLPPANWSAATGSEGEFEFTTSHFLPMMIKSQCLDRSRLIKFYRIHFLLMMSKEAVSGPESPPAVWSALRISPGCILHLIRAGQGLFGHHHQRSRNDMMAN